MEDGDVLVQHHGHVGCGEQEVHAGQTGVVVIVVVVVVLMLGKQVWTIIGDSKKCFKGKMYTRQIIMII